MSVRFKRTGTEKITDHNELTNRGTRTHAEIDSYLAEIDTARGTKADLDARLDDIEAKDTEQDNALDLHDTAMSAHDSRLVSLETEQTSQNTRLDTVEGDITDLENEVQTARGTFTNLDERLDDMTTKIGTGGGGGSPETSQEVIDARTDNAIPPTTFANLKARLDDMQGKLGTGGGGGSTPPPNVRVFEDTFDTTGYVNSAKTTAIVDGGRVRSAKGSKTTDSFDDISKTDLANSNNIVVDTVEGVAKLQSGVVQGTLLNKEITTVGTDYAIIHATLDLPSSLGLSDVQVVEEFTAELMNAVVAVDPNGRKWVVYQRKNSTGYWKVYGIIYNTNGSVYKAPWLIDETSSTNSYNINLVVGNDGRMSVFWHSNTTSGGVKHIVLNLDGSVYKPQVTLDAGALANGATYLGATLNPFDGKIWVYYDFLNTASTVTATFRVLILNADYSVFKAPFTADLNSDQITGAYDTPRACALPSGNMMFVVFAKRNTGTTDSNQGIYRYLMTPDGIGLNNAEMGNIVGYNIASGNAFDVTFDGTNAWLILPSSGLTLLKIPESGVATFYGNLGQLNMAGTAAYKAMSLTYDSIRHKLLLAYPTASQGNGEDVRLLEISPDSGTVENGMYVANGVRDQQAPFVYFDRATGETTIVYGDNTVTTSPADPITSDTICLRVYKPVATEVDFIISNDGINYVPAPLGEQVTFPTAGGNKLRVKAILNSPTIDVTPKILSYTIEEWGRTAQLTSEFVSIGLPSTDTISKALLSADVELNNGTVTWFMSNDGGANFYEVALGQAFVFPSNLGNDLRVKAVLESPVTEPLSPNIDRYSITSEGTILQPLPANYDNQNVNVIYSLNANGAVASEDITDSGGRVLRKTEYTYNDNSSVYTEKVTENGKSFVKTFSYDSLGNVTGYTVRNV